jgi:hypothetical protein
VIAGEVDFSFRQHDRRLPQVQAGSVRGLAVTSHKRRPYLPELPRCMRHSSPLCRGDVERHHGPVEDSRADHPQIV